MGRLARGVASLLIGCCSGLPEAGLAQSDDALWTQKPVRIDRSKQHFERLPAVQHEIDTRSWIIVPDRIKVLDSTSFSFGGRTYRIGGVHAVPMKRLCRDKDAGRWACGRMATIFLGNLVRSKHLLCHAAPGRIETVLSDCQLGSRDPADEILAAGFGRADDTGKLQEAEQAAQAKQAGLWRNPACLADFDGC